MHVHHRLLLPELKTRTTSETFHTLYLLSTPIRIVCVVWNLFLNCCRRCCFSIFYSHFFSRCFLSALPRWLLSLFHLMITKVPNKYSNNMKKMRGTKWTNLWRFVTKCANVSLDLLLTFSILYKVDCSVAFRCIVNNKSDEFEVCHRRR